MSLYLHIISTGPGMHLIKTYAEQYLLRELQVKSLKCKKDTENGNQRRWL